MTRGLLLERDAERQRMAGALAEARAGRGSVLIVHGPAGIGKSSLLGAGIDDAHDLGFLVARAVGSELETELALGVARTLAAALVAGAGDVDLGGSAARAHLLTQPTGKPTDAWAAIDGLHWLLARVAEHQPVLVVVDDAHVADPPSQRALGYLAARVADAAVVLAVAVRTGSGGTTPIAERLLDLPDAIGIRPKSLSHRAVRLLVEHYLGTPASDSFVEACRDATRGNPFLLNALLGELGAEEATPDDEHAARVARLAPPGVLRSIVLRLNRLGPDATATAHALAVLGDAQPLPLLAQVSDLPVGVVEAAIDALVGADLVAQASGQAPVFAHPVVRSTLARAIAGSARVTLHERAAAALTAAGAGPDRVAPHLLPIPGTGDQERVAILRAAAQVAAQAGNAATEAAYLRRALAEPPSPERRNRLVVETALSAARAGDPDAREVLARAQAAAPGSGLAGVLARARAGVGDLAGALAGLDEVLATVALSEEDHRRLRVVRAELSLLDSERREQGRAELDGLLEELGHADAADRAVLAMAAYLACTSSLDRERARDLTRRAAAGSAAAVLDDLNVSTYILLVLALRITEDLDRSGELLDHLVDTSALSGSPEAYAQATAWRSGHQLWVGRVHDALADAEAAHRAAHGTTELATPLPAALCEAQLLAGDLNGARRTAAGPWRHDAGPGRLARVGQPYAQGLVALHDGDPHRALDDFLRCGRFQLEVGTTNGASLKWRAMAAVAASRADDDRAPVLLEEELELARAFGAPRSLAVVLIAASEVLASPVGGNDAAGGVAAAEEAAALPDLHDPVTRGRALLAVGRFRHDAGDDAAAREALYRSLDLLDGTGAEAAAAEVVAALRGAGGRPQRANRRGPAALTPSERRIAQLAVDGLTNREIAEKTFVSISAVEFHLRNAFKKLGITRRTELKQALSH